MTLRYDYDLILSCLIQTRLNIQQSHIRMLLENMSQCIVIIVLCAIFSIVHSKSVTVGQVYEQNGVRKVFEQIIEAVALPLLKREQEIDIDIADVQIKGIVLKDLDNGKAEPSITSGGLGLNYAKLKFKSERGSRIKFLVEVYA